MSQAFLKEQDDSVLANQLPDRPQSEHPNYVTREGLERLHAKVRDLQERRASLEAQVDDPHKQQELAQVERDLRYYQGRIEKAIVVDLSQQPTDEVHFGAIVEVEDENGEHHTFTIVGEDEADVTKNRVSWVSPLAKAMLGAKVGDTVTWQRPAGDLELEIVKIRYPD
ncbi:GreA/GreB family elongation factor [Pelomicrobium methylotrophicum]|uniref:Transcription elongation factor GreAB n=1 Tax=Pelomicrobium methylotrophicum TaxID=2602750 RepID=A0A5C7EGK3_9PROT|nr:GreA/GreB family elongation factor [Pelomicrobium methylotrophicum]TXF10424.1 transcription elongation factor GreAB [Pelomicrobium methylotrophicum]